MSKHEIPSEFVRHLLLTNDKAGISCFAAPLLFVSTMKQIERLILYKIDLISDNAVMKVRLKGPRLSDLKFLLPLAFGGNSRNTPF